MLAMSPVRQYKVLEQRLNCFVGDSPTLNNIATAYGKTAPIQWLIAQLVNLSEFCGVRDKMTGDQLEELATLLAKSYPYYKITQFMAFFLDFKMGKYGRFYGSIDPMVITEAIMRFDHERCEIIGKWEKEQEKLEADEHAKSVISFEDYLATIPPKERGNDYDEPTFREAQFCLNNALEGDLSGKFRRLFAKRIGCSPEEYIAKYSEKK